MAEQLHKVTKKSSQRYINSVLTIIAMLLLMLVMRVPTGSGADGEVYAQRTRRTNPQPQQQPTNNLLPFDAASQRERIITALENISTRMTAVESKLSSPLNVRVTEMPDLAGLVKASNHD